METLDWHRDRVTALREALERLMALHQQIYDCQEQIVALARGEAPDRVERLSALHAKVRELRPEIERAKRELAAPRG
jgi:hypothetical protein